MGGSWRVKCAKSETRIKAQKESWHIWERWMWKDVHMGREDFIIIKTNLYFYSS